MVGVDLLKPSAHLQSLAKSGNLVFQLDNEGQPEIWLGDRLWEVSGKAGASTGDVLDPGAPGPVVRVMSPSDQKYITAYITVWLSRL